MIGRGEVRRRRGEEEGEEEGGKGEVGWEEYGRVRGGGWW